MVIKTRDPKVLWFTDQVAELIVRDYGRCFYCDCLNVAIFSNQLPSGADGICTCCLLRIDDPDTQESTESEKELTHT